MQSKRETNLTAGNRSFPIPIGRLVVKAGTGVLTGGADRLDHEVMAALVGQIAQLHAGGTEVTLVTSGAVAAGKQVLGSSGERKDIHFRQVLAAVGQSRLMRSYEELFLAHEITVAQGLLTRNDLSNRQGYLNVRNTLLTLLKLRVVPILNENDVSAVDELRAGFGDNDTLSGLVANLVDADVLAILTDTDGLYTSDPDIDPDARLISRVEKVDDSIEALAGRHLEPGARGGMPTKLEAAKLTTSSGIPTMICNGRKPDVLLKLSRGEEIGTLFLPTAEKMESRKRWMLSSLSNQGEIRVDSGASLALKRENRSLLPAGVKGVAGKFSRGDVVYISGSESGKVACGIANYSSEDIDRIKGSRSDRIQGILGYNYGEEVVHRDNMVLL